MKKTFSVIICFATLIVIVSAASTNYKPPRFKNLKILPKNISEVALDSIMDHFSISLGVKCGFCHVHNEEKKTWDMASDDNPGKLIARKMMLMTNEINTKYFPTEKNTKDPIAIQTITCYTCHKGEVIPISVAETKEKTIK